MKKALQLIDLIDRDVLEAKGDISKSVSLLSRVSSTLRKSDVGLSVSRDSEGVQAQIRALPSKKNEPTLQGKPLKSLLVVFQ